MTLQRNEDKPAGWSKKYACPMNCYRSALGIKCLLYRGSVKGLLFFFSRITLSYEPESWQKAHQTIRHYLVCCVSLCYANHKSPMNDSLFGDWLGFFLHNWALPCAWVVNQRDDIHYQQRIRSNIETQKCAFFDSCGSWAKSFWPKNEVQEHFSYPITFNGKVFKVSGQQIEF